MDASKRFLIALDGSDQSAEAVRYAGAALPRHGTEIVLLHVLNSVPEVLRDIETDSALLPNKLAARQWERQQRTKIQDFMEMARKLLLEAGFPEKAITAEIRERKEGLARDISTEACGGDYHALIVGRSGTNDLCRSTLGGIAARVAANCHLPVWLIGGKPATGKILIGIDSSAGSTAAAVHVAKIHNNSDGEVRLLHVVKRDGELHEGFERQILERYFNEIHRKTEEAIAPVFEEAREILVDSGISHGKISTKVVVGVSSRSGAILREAALENFGTIVLRRRELGRMIKFDMGSVRDKLIHMAGNQAVWVVGP